MARSGSSHASTAAGRRRAARRGASTGHAGKRRPPAKPAKSRSRPPARRAAPKPSSKRPKGPSWRLRLALLAGLAVAAAAGYQFWLRDSSLVAVNDVEVVGVTGSERERIVAALTGVSEGMSTLGVDRERIEQAALRFPTVAAIEIDPNFPHGLRLEIAQRPPVLVAAPERAAGGDSVGVPVAGDGTILAGVEIPEEPHLPTLEIEDGIEGATRLTGDELAQAVVVGAAPGSLRPLIERIAHSDEFGVELTLRGGISLRFGEEGSAAAKWAAAAAVLADPKLDSVDYVDVRVPRRPAVCCDTASSGV